MSKRADRRAARRAARQQRIETRQKARTERTMLRTEAKKVAYENGIAPGAATIGAIGSGLGAVASVASGGLVPPLQLPGFSQPDFGISGGISGSLSVATDDALHQPGQDKTKMYLIMAAVAAFFLMFIKRK